METSRSKSPARLNRDEALLAEVFVRSGCFRVPNARRRKCDGQSYKKGYELRLAVTGPEELSAVRRSLLQLGITPGEPYRKSRRTVQIVYGKKSVMTFVRLLRTTGVKSSKLIELEPGS
jgi:hypothetical protein